MSNQPKQCPHCKNDDDSMMELHSETEVYTIYICNVCSKIFSVKKESPNG